MIDRDCRECEHFDHERIYCDKKGRDMRLVLLAYGKCEHFKSREDEAPMKKITKLTWKVWRGNPPQCDKCGCYDPVMYDTEIYGADHYHDHLLLCNGCVTALQKEIIKEIIKEPVREEKKEVEKKRTKTCQWCKHWDLSDSITDTDGVMIRGCASPSWYGKYEWRGTDSCKYWEERDDEAPMKKEKKTCAYCKYWDEDGTPREISGLLGTCKTGRTCLYERGKYNVGHACCGTYSCSRWEEREGEKEVREEGEILTCLDCTHLWSDAKWADHRMRDLNVSDNKHGCDCHINGFNSLEIRLCTHFVLKEKEKEMKKPVFKVGDRVIVHGDENDPRNGGLYVHPDMLTHEGEEFVVRKIAFNGNCYLSDGFYYEPHWLELVSKDVTGMNREFKPGDRVIIDVEGKDRTESPTISDEMMKMHGEEHVIEKKTHGEWYVLECTRRPWGWIPKWLRASTRHGTVLEDVPIGRYYCEARDRERGRYCGEVAVRGVTRTLFSCYPQDVVRFACEKHLGKLLTKEGDEEEMKEPTFTTCEEEEKGHQPFERALEIYTAELAKEAKQAAEVLKIESALETKHLKIVDNILTEAEYLVDLNNGYKQLSGKDLVRKGFRFGRNGFKYRGDPDLWDDPYVKFRKHKGHKRSLEIGTGSFPDKAVCFKNGDRATYCTAGILTKALRVIEGAIKQ